MKKDEHGNMYPEEEVMIKCRSLYSPSEADEKINTIIKLLEDLTLRYDLVPGEEVDMFMESIMKIYNRLMDRKKAAEEERKDFYSYINKFKPSESTLPDLEDYNRNL